MEGNSIVSNDVLTGIADAINAKAGESTPMTVQEMAGKIGSIPEVPEGYVEFSGVGRIYCDPNSVGDNAFSNCYSLTAVSLPSATSIGGSVFYFCYSLTAVSLPSATSIGDNAFSNCNFLTAVSFPSATSIGVYTFSNCYSLTEVSLPSATSIGGYTFSNCNNLTSLTLTSMTVAQVQYNAFAWEIPYNCTVTCKDGTVTIN